MSERLITLYSVHNPGNTEGVVYNNVALGAVKPDEVTPALIEEAREAAGLSKEQRTIVLGSNVVGIEFMPPLQSKQAAIFARRMAGALGAVSVECYEVGFPPRRHIGTIPVAD